VIQVREIRKTFGARAAVDRLSFEVRKGETLGLLGPNGAGKTTTLHLLAGLLTPDSGTVSVAGEENPAQAKVRRHLGVSPQALALYEDLTGAENLAFFGRLYGLAGAKLRERVAWGLNFAELTERGAERLRAYSGGMQRRLSVACALIHEPRVLLLDEPTAGVDPQSRNHLLERIATLKSQGLTILFTTHYIEEAERLCERVAIMDAGRILACDTVEQLRAQHGGSLEKAFLDLTGRSLRD